MYNLENQRFGHLTVIKYIPGSKWFCHCDCGNEIIINTQSLLRGKTKSCGCQERSKSLIGQRFGRLTVIDILDDKKCICRCDCGNTKIIRKHNFLYGRTQSCGCLRQEKADLDITSQRFGLLTAVKSTGKSDGHSIIWLFKCDCGNEIELPRYAVKYQHQISCGCIFNGNRSEFVLDTQKHGEGVSASVAAYILSNNMNKNNSSGYKGIVWAKTNKKWVANIQYNGSRHYLGCFEKIEDAVAAREEAEKRLYGPLLQKYEEYKKQNKKN